MSEAIELRKIAAELKDLNHNLSHTNRLIRDIGEMILKKERLKEDKIPEMVNDLGKVVEQHAPKTMGSFEQMKAAMEENARHKRYQEPKEF